MKRDALPPSGAQQAADFQATLERVIAGVEHDADFDLERFLAAVPEHADAVRARVAKLRRFGLLRSSSYQRASPELPEVTMLPARSLAGRYRVLREIGRGGMGRVLLARDERLAREVAVKLAHKPGDDPARARLEREAQLLAQLEHPGIVAVYDGGVTDDGRAFCAMRVVGGRTLHEVIAEAADEFGLARKVQIAIAVCDAINFAHSRGIVHRDLKPANVMLGDNGEVQVVDWGLAKRLTAPDPDAPADRESFASFSTGAYETVDGYAFGTPSYCAPEQARGELAEIDERSDVFGLGAILHHLLAGRPPYYGEDRAEVLARAREGRLNDPELKHATPRAPPELVAICRKACAPSKTERYASARELADDLRAFLETRTVAAYEVGTWAETKKWVARNRALAGSLAAALLILVAGTITSAVYAKQAGRMSAAARLSAADALRSKQSSDRAADIAREQARLADRVTEQAMQLVGLRARVGQPGYDEELGRTLIVLARESAARGRYEFAVRCAEQTLEIARTFPPDGRHLAIQTCIELASFRRMAGDLEGAARGLEEAEAMLQEDFGLETELGMLFLNERAVVRRRRGDLDGAIEDNEAVLATGAAIGTSPTKWAGVMNNLAVVLSDAGRIGEARTWVEKALQLQRSDPSRPLAELVQSVATAGAIAMTEKRWDEAEPLLREAVESRRLLNGADARETLQAQHNLAAYFMERGDLAAADALLEPTLQLQIEHFGAEDFDALDSLRSKAHLRWIQGRASEALSLCREARTGFERINAVPAKVRAVLTLELELLRAAGDVAGARSTEQALIDLGGSESPKSLNGQAPLKRDDRERE